MRPRVRNEGGTPGWKTLVAELQRRDTISAEGVARLVKQHTRVTTDYALRRLQREGVLLRPAWWRRGLYVAAKGKAGAFIADPIEAVQAVCGQDAVFGYGTALFLHGLSRYGRITEYYVVSATRQNQRSVGRFVIRFIKAPLPDDTGTVTRRHGKVSVHMTDLERTLIDCIHRPKYAQGWENVVQAIDRANGVNAGHMIAYVKQYRTPSLVAKVGWVIEHYAVKWRVPEDSLQSLRPYLPRTPVKFSRGIGGELNRNWNVIVPEGLFHA